MNLLHLAIAIIVFVAVFAIVAWFIKYSELVIPKPVMIAIYAAVAIIAILVIASLAGFGPAIRFG